MSKRQLMAPRRKKKQKIIEENYSYLKNEYLDFILQQQQQFNQMERQIKLIISKRLLNLPASSLANVTQDFYYQIGRSNEIVHYNIRGVFESSKRLIFYMIYGCLPLITYVDTHFNSENNSVRDDLTIYMLVRLLERCMLLFHPFDAFKNNLSLPHPFSNNKENYRSTIEKRYDLKLSTILQRYGGTCNDFLIHIIFLTTLSAFEKKGITDRLQMSWKGRMGIARYDTQFNPYYRPIKYQRYPVYQNYPMENVDQKNIFVSQEPLTRDDSFLNYSEVFTNNFNEVFEYIIDCKIHLEQVYQSYIYPKMSKVNTKGMKCFNIAQDERLSKMFGESNDYLCFYDDDTLFVHCTSKLFIHHISLERYVYKFIHCILPDQPHLPLPETFMDVVISEDSNDLLIKVMRNELKYLPGEMDLTLEHDDVIESFKGFYLSCMIILVMNLKMSKRNSDYDTDLIDFCLFNRNFFTFVFTYLPNLTNPAIAIKRDFKRHHAPPINNNKSRIQMTKYVEEAINFYGLLLGESSLVLGSTIVAEEEEGYGSDDVDMGSFGVYNDRSANVSTIVKTIWDVHEYKYNFAVIYCNKILQIMVANEDMLYDILAHHDENFLGRVRENKDTFLKRLEGLYAASNDQMRNIDHRGG